MSKGNDLMNRTAEDQKRAIDIYDNFRDELNKRQLSNTENYDKAILTLSSAGLAISLSFIKNIVPLDKAEYLYLLKISWGAFLISIVLSLIAYLISNAAMKRQLLIAEDYYVNKRKSALTEKNKLSTYNDRLNLIMGLFFILAISILVLFVTLNIDPKDPNMSNNESKTVNMVSKAKSASVPTMQAVVTVEPLVIHSAQVPTMQAAPSSAQAEQSSPAEVQQTQTSNKE